MAKNVKAVSERYAGFWIRFLAAVLDTIIIWVPVILIYFALLFATGVKSLVYIINLAAIVLVIYMEGIKGGTPGKLILGLRVVNDEKKYIGIPKAILRYISKILSAITIFIGYLMIGWTQKKQGLHDKIAKTYVVYVK